MADKKVIFQKKTFHFFIQSKNCLKCDFYHQKQLPTERKRILSASCCKKNQFIWKIHSKVMDLYVTVIGGFSANFGKEF